MLQVAVVTVVVAVSFLFFDEYYANWAAFYVLCEAALLISFLRIDVSSSILGFFGRISYSHYLYHAAAGYAFFAFIPASGSVIVNLIVVGLVIALTTAIAFVSYRFVEEPMVAFRKKHERLWTCRRERALP